METKEEMVNGEVYQVKTLSNGTVIRELKMTDTQLEVLYPPKAQFNRERNGLFAETTWVRERHNDLIEQGKDDPGWKAWLAYWQALRDMPAQEKFDPQNPIWPEKPELRERYDSLGG